MTSRELNIVLIEPEIPQNTGNVGRTCVGLGAALHLVGKLGFSLDSSQLKRAGLDYWPKLDLNVHASWEAFKETLPVGADLCFFSTHGKIPIWQRQFKKPLYLVFGSESKGFPKDFYTTLEKELVRIPVGSDIRSLNLATAAGVAAFEAVRQFESASAKL